MLKAKKSPHSWMAIHKRQMNLEMIKDVHDHV
jgi:hypothetical protein